MRRMSLLVIIISLFLAVLNCTTVNETQRPAKLTEGLQARFKEETDKKISDLFKINPVLTEELRKLPELKRGLDEKGLVALKRIVSYYTQSPRPDETKSLFDRILSIGKKERRKFSAPLQALFWLAEEQELPLDENPLKIYSKEKYRGFNKHLGEDEEVITFIYNIWRKTYATGKWEDPNEIIDRLNSPHLFDIYFSNNILYDWDKLTSMLSGRRWHENWDLQSSKVTIIRKKGTCSDATRLAEETLKKAGYDIKPLQIKFRKPTFTAASRHVVGLLKEGGSFFIIADHPSKEGGIKGPFKSIKEAGKTVAEGLGNVMENYFLSYDVIR